MCCMGCSVDLTISVRCHHCDGSWFQQRDIPTLVPLYRLSLKRCSYGSKRSYGIGGLFFERGPVTIRYGLTLGLHRVGTSPITHRRHTVLQDGKTAIVFAFLSLRFFRRILSGASSRFPHTYIQRSTLGGARRFTHALARQTRTHGIAAVAALAPTGRHFCFNDDTYVRIAGSSQRRNACWYPLSTLLSDLSSFGNAWQRSASVVVQEVQNGCDAWDCATASGHPAHCGALVPPIRNQRLLPAPVVTMLNDQCVGCMTRSDQHAAASESVHSAFSRRRSCELRKSGQN
jgi:hypothetical protein